MSSKKVRFSPHVTVFEWTEMPENKMARAGHWVPDALRFKCRVDKLCKLLTPIFRVRMK